MRTGATIAVLDLDRAPSRGPAVAAEAVRAGRERLAWTCLGAASGFSFLLLTRAYRGLIHDSNLYVGRALADLDPGGLGRDILFALDGQTAFSLFPRILRGVVAGLGPEAASALVTLAGLAAWFAAMALLVRRLVRPQGAAGQGGSGRAAFAALIFVAVMPAFYGGFSVFRYAEQFATPRPLAEAAVLAALAALLAGRPWRAALWLAAGAALHPIMAAPGCAIWLIVQGRRDPRWFMASGLGAAAIAGAAWLGAPVASRLFVVIDPDWAAAMSANAYLFPSVWPAGDWSAILLQAVSLGLAAHLVGPGRARTLLLAVLATAAAGVVLTLLAADRVLVLLILQVQPWRALWLVALLSAATLPIVAVALWRRGPAGRMALAALAFAWLSAASPAMAATGAALALLLVGLADRPGFAMRPAFATAAWIAVALYSGLFWAQRAGFAWALFAAMPRGAALFAELWSFWAFSLPIAAAALAWAIGARPRPSLASASCATLVLAVATTALWDDRPAQARRFDGQVADADLVRLLPDRPGEILWLRNGGYAAWSQTGRQNWVSYLQGASMIFSRDLALLWRDRMDRLRAAHLADESDRLPFISGTRVTLRPGVGDIAAICGAADGPIALVVPLDAEIVLPEAIRATAYVSPWPTFAVTERDGRAAWGATARRLAIVDCARF